MKVRQVLAAGNGGIKSEPVALRLEDKAQVHLKALCTLDVFNAAVRRLTFRCSYLQTLLHVSPCVCAHIGI